MIARLRSLTFDAFFYSFTAAYLIFFLPFVIFLPRRFTFILFRAWTRICLTMLAIIVGLKYTVRGRKHLDATTAHGPCIIACKHQSAFDTIFISMFLDDIVIILKGQLALVPFFGYYLKKLGSIFIDRDNKTSAIRDLMRKSRNAIADNRSLFIFPEGTRAKPGESIPYQRGISLLYKDLNVPVIPVALNTGVFWGRKSSFKRAGEIIIDIQPPIAPGLDRDHFMDVLQNTIDTASTKLLNTQPPKKMWFKRIVTFLTVIIISLACAGYISIKMMIDQRLQEEGIHYTDSKLHLSLSALPSYELINVSADSPALPGSLITIQNMRLTPTGAHKVTVEANNMNIQLYGTISANIPYLEAFIEQYKNGKSVPYIHAKNVNLNIGDFSTSLNSIEGNYKHKSHLLTFACYMQREKPDNQPLLFIKSSVEKKDHQLSGEIMIQTTFGDQFIQALKQQGMITVEKELELKSALQPIAYESNQTLKQITIPISQS